MLLEAIRHFISYISINNCRKKHSLQLNHLNGPFVEWLLNSRVFLGANPIVVFIVKGYNVLHFFLQFPTSGCGQRVGNSSSCLLLATDEFFD